MRTYKEIVKNYILIYIKYEKNRLGFSVLILIKSSYSSVSPNSTEFYPLLFSTVL